MLNELGSYHGTLDTSKNDLTRKSCERNYCANGVELSRPPNLPDPATSWNYPYLGNFCNYYSNNSYELSNVHQYDNQKCGAQFPRNYPQHPSLSSTSVLQCCDPRCQLLSEHSKYPFNHLLSNKINQRTKRSKNYYTGILDLPKPADPVKTDHVNKYSPCIPYASLRNDLNAKYNGQPSEYSVPYENTLKSSKHVLLSDTSTFGDYYTDIGKPSYWSKQNLWNRNVAPSYYPTYDQDPGYNQKLPASVHNQIGASSTSSRGILFNRLLDHRDRPNDAAYVPNYYYSKQNQFPKGVREYSQTTMDQESVYANDIANNTRLPGPNNSYQCLPTTYNPHYPEETTPALMANCYKENLTPPLKPVEKQNEQKTCILDKNPNLDVREFLSTWDDVEDDKLPENTNEAQSLQPAPVIVLDCTTLEGDVLAKVKEKLSQNITSLEGNATNIGKQFDSGSNSAVLKIVENENTAVPPCTSVIEDATATVAASEQLKDCQVDQKFESSHLNSDGFLTWYSSNSKKKDDLSYNLVEMTERLVNTVDKLFNEPEKKSIPKTYESQYEPQNNKEPQRYEVVGSENKWNVNLNYKKSKIIDKCSSNVPLSSGGSQLTHYHQNLAGNVANPFKNYQPSTYDQQTKEQPFLSSSLNENKNISCSLNLSKTSNDFKFSVNYSKQANEFNTAKSQDFSIKYRNANGYPYYQKPVASKAMPLSVGEFYKNSYDNFNSCQYDNTNYDTSRDVIANEKECPMNYVEHMDKDLANETDITLVKADLEKSLNEITHQFSYHKQNKIDGVETNNSQEPNSTNDMVSNKEIETPADSLVESVPYPGVTQKTESCRVYEEPTCENSLLSMPSLSPPLSPGHVPSKSISSINLTLNDVYENNVIFDTEELNSKETTKMIVVQELEDIDAVTDSRYQPLNLALSRDSKTNNNDLHQHKILTPTLPSHFPPVLNKDTNLTCAESFEETAVSNKNVPKADDGYYSVETEQDNAKPNNTSTGGTLEVNQIKKIATAPYQTSTVSPKQNDMILDENHKCHQEAIIPASPCIQDLSTGCSLLLKELQPPKLTANGECALSSAFHLSEEDNCKGLSCSPTFPENDCSYPTNKAVTAMGEENKLEEKSAYLITSMPVTNYENQKCNVENNAALICQSSKNLIPATSEKFLETNGVEEKIGDDHLVNMKMELKKKYKHKHKKFNLKNTSNKQNPKLVDDTKENGNKLNCAKEETYLHIQQMASQSIIEKNDSIENRICKTNFQTCEPRSDPEGNKFEEPEQYSIPFKNTPNFKVPVCNGHSVSENGNLIIKGEIKMNTSKLEIDDKLVQVQNLSTCPEYMKLKKRKFVGIHLPMKKRKQDLDIIRLATETVSKWSPTSPGPIIAEIEKHAEEKCANNQNHLDHTGLSSAENYKYYKKRHKKEKKLKKKFKKRRSCIENGNYEQDNKNTSSTEFQSQHALFLKRSKSWTELAGQKKTSFEAKGHHNFFNSHECNLGRSRTPPPAIFDSVNWCTSIPSAHSRSLIQSPPLSPCPSNGKLYPLVDCATCSPQYTLNDVCNSEKEDQEPACKSVADDYIFNIPSIAPTPNCDLIRDDNADFEAPKSNQPTSLTPVTEACKDVVPSSFALYSAPTPNCSLKHDDLDDSDISDTLQNQPQYSINSYKSLSHEFEMQSSKAPSPNFILEDSFSNEKELSKAPSPYCDLTGTFAPIGDHEKQEESNPTGLSSISSPSSVAPSPNCDIIEGVLFDDSDFGKINNEFVANNAESRVAKIQMHSRPDFEKTFTNDTIDMRFEAIQNSENVAELNSEKSPVDFTASPLMIINGMVENVKDHFEMASSEQKVIEKNATADPNKLNSFFEKDISKNCEFFSISQYNKCSKLNNMATNDESNNSNDQKDNDTTLITDVANSDLDKLALTECAEKMSEFTDYNPAVAIANNCNKLVHINRPDFLNRVTNNVNICDNSEYPDELMSPPNSSSEPDIANAFSSDEESNYMNGPKCDQPRVPNNADQNDQATCPVTAENVQDNFTESNELCIENLSDIANYSSINGNKSPTVANQTSVNVDQCSYEENIHEDHTKDYEYTSTSLEPVSDNLNKDEVSKKLVGPVDNICQNIDKLTQCSHSANDLSCTNEIQPINIILDEEESDPHVIPSLRSLAFTVLANIRSNHNNLEVFFTSGRMEIVIHADDQDLGGTILSDHCLDSDSINDADAPQDKTDTVPYLNKPDHNPLHLELPNMSPIRDHDGMNSADALENETDVSSHLNKPHYDPSLLEFPNMNSIRDHSLSDSLCHCFVINNEEPFTCFRCSLNCSIVVNEEDQIDGRFREMEVDECEDDTIEDDYFLLENEHSDNYFLYDCIEESFIDQNVSFSPKSNINVTVEDTQLFPNKDSAYPMCKVPGSSSNTSKFQIKVQLPWHKIFNLGDENEIECREPKILELGPAQIEVRLSTDDSISIKSSSSNNENSSPVVKVKRLVIQRRQQQSDSDRGFDGQKNELHSVRHAAALITNSIPEEELNHSGDETKNVEDARPIPRIPKMVIRKTSYREYKSYLSPNDELQPVVRLFKSKSLDELALRLYGENYSGETTINVSKIERSLTDYTPRYKSWQGTTSKAIGETLTDEGSIQTAENRRQQVTENRISTEDIFLKDENDVEYEETTSRPKFPKKPERHHCLLCHRSYTSHESYHLHVKSRFHRHLELTQRKTIHALYRHFTGHICPRLRPLSVKERKKMKWKPRSANVNHFYHQKTPLQIALHKSVLTCETK